MMLGLLAGSSTLLGARPSFAQAGGLLEKVRKAGVIKIGITNGLPYSSLNPDGSVDGVAPTLVRTVMERIGVPKVEGIVVTYGQLIPGLQAGRWDMIGADMTITKERCAQVTYCDPFTVDYAAYPYLKSEMPNPPKTIKEIGERKMKFAVLAGAYNMKAFRAAYEKPDDYIQVYPDSPAILEALIAKRAQIGCTGVRVIRETIRQKPGSFEYLYPLPDDMKSAASAAFRQSDTDLSTAFIEEFRKMKVSGEWQKIITGFTFDVFPGSAELTGPRACAEADDGSH